MPPYVMRVLQPGAKNRCLVEAWRSPLSERASGWLKRGPLAPVRGQESLGGLGGGVRAEISEQVAP